MIAKLRDVVNGGINTSEETIAKVLAMLGGTVDNTKAYGNEKYAQGKAKAGESYDAVSIDVCLSLLWLTRFTLDWQIRQRQVR